MRLLILLAGLIISGALAGLAFRGIGEVYGESAGVAAAILAFCVGMAVLQTLCRQVGDRSGS